MNLHTQPNPTSGGLRLRPSTFGRKLKDRLIVLLCGGDKPSQDRDIEQAHRIAEEWKNDDQDD